MSNPLEIALAFVEGLALIASPCILPVLPLILGASVQSGKQRPFGVIVGFIVTFSLFAFFSRKLFDTLNINPIIINYVAIGLLILFSLILLSQKLSALFSRMVQKTADWGVDFNPNPQSGFFSGVIIGGLVGLIWTPCAGPILAAVLVEVIHQQTNIQAMIVLLAFATGAALPMLLIVLASRWMMTKIQRLHKHTETIRKLSGLVMLLGALFLLFTATPTIFQSSSIPPLSASGSATAEKIDMNNVLIDALSNPYPAPELRGIDQWLNSDKPLTLAELKGKVVLIDFWTYSCINCVRSLPYISELDRKYRDKGLVIIGVHAPEFAFEKNSDNVRQAIAQHKINYPVALDNNFDTWSAYQNRYWPAHYLIDKKGQVVYTHFGEGNYQELENNIRYLLGIDGNATDTTQVVTPNFSPEQTPETYLGWERASRFQSELALSEGVHTYQFPVKLTRDNWGLAGQWQVQNERIIAKQAGAAIRLQFTASQVFLVLGKEGPLPVNVKVLLDGQPVNSTVNNAIKEGVLVVDRYNLYQLVNLHKVHSGTVEIIAETPGLEAYAFTFGSTTR